MRTRFLLTAALLSASVLTACDRPASNADSGANSGAAEGPHASDEQMRRELDAIASQPIPLYADNPVPKATIAANGDFAIDRESIAIDETQRARLVAYRGYLVTMAQAGIDMDSRFMNAVAEKIDAKIDEFFDSKSSESPDPIAKPGAQKERIQVAGRRICEALPGLLREQQALVDSIPRFAPYAHFAQADVDACRDGVVFDQASGEKIGKTIAAAIGNPFRGGMIAGFMAAKNEPTADAESGAERTKPAAQ
ncbi:MAG: hypothetical protein IT473_14695 [Lysobacter sp.]|nr:hypothetical protein [Lysobacter sp.]